MGKLFSGGGKSSAYSAQEDARKSREANQITQERQLQMEHASDSKADASLKRRAPKGRRLFEERDTLGRVS